MAGITTVIKTIGSGGDYTTLQSHEDAAPSNYTTFRTGANCTGGTGSTIILDASASGTDSFYVGHAVYITARPTDKMLITAYVGATKIATVGVLNGGGSNWVTTPTTGEAYEIDGTIWQGQIKSASDGFTAALTVGGGTDSSGAYYQLTTATGASFRDNANVQTNALRFNTANGCYLAVTAGFTTPITISGQDNTRISNLQIFLNNSGSGNLAYSGAGFVDFCIVESNAAGAPTGILYMGNGKVRNCAVIGRSSTLTYLLRLDGGSSGINCTVACVPSFTPPTVGINSNFGTAMVTNCSIYGAAAVGSGTITYTTCYTDLGSPPTGCTQATYNTTQFQNITDATRDYRIPSGSAFIDVGTTDSTNAAIDIAKTTRPQGSAYDVGCWEYVSAASYKPYFGLQANVTMQTGAPLQ